MEHLTRALKFWGLSGRTDTLKMELEKFIKRVDMTDIKGLNSVILKKLSFL